MRLRPKPRLRKLTYDVFERGCLALGLDPDKILQGDIVINELRDPTIAEAEAFLGIVLRNAGSYDLRRMALDRAIAFTSVVIADFLMASVQSSRYRMPTGKA